MDTKQHTLLAARIELPGFGPTTEELLARRAIINELDARGAGRFLKKDDGIRSLDIAYEVEHAEFSKIRFSLIIEKHMPNHPYTTHTKPIAASKDFATAVHDRRSVHDRRHMSRRAQTERQRGLDFGW